MCEVKYNVLFSAEDLKMVALLMERSTLTGKEVPLYINVQRALMEARETHGDDSGVRKAEAK